MDDARLWRRDRGAMLSGVCAGLAEDLDLPLPLVRAVSVIFVILPTGLAYLALSLLLRRRPMRGRSPVGVRSGGPLGARTGTGTATPRPAPVQKFALLAHRLEALEPRLKRIEAYVTSDEFELHGGFRRMGE